MNQDTRLQNIVRVRQHALGVAVGGDAAAPNVAMRRIASAATQFLDAADDVRRSLAGPAQRGQLISERSGPLLKVINEAAKEIASHRASVAARMSVPIFAPWSDTPPAYHRAAVALTVGERFYKSSPAERAKTLGAIAADPAANLDVIEALSSVPPIVSGIRPNELQALHTLAFKATKPDEYSSLEVEQQQLGIAARAVAVALDIVRDGGADTSSLASLAPDANALLHADVPRWIDARVVLQQG